jgi:hypothetical protein
VILHPITSEVIDRRRRIEKALRDGTLTAQDGRFFTSDFCFVFKDGPSPILGYARSGNVQRTPDENGAYWAVVTTDESDRDGDVVWPLGRLGQNYARNPTWLCGHGEWALPIGTSRAKDGRILVVVEDNRVRQGCIFDVEDPDADFLRGKVERGMVNATSIAFVPIEAYRRSDVEKATPHGDRYSVPAGYLFQQWDHTETSWVPVGANASATVDIAGDLRDSLDKEKSFISYRMQKCLRPFAAVAKGCWNGFCPCPPCCDEETTPVPSKGVEAALGSGARRSLSAAGASGETPLLATGAVSSAKEATMAKPKKQTPVKAPQKAKACSCEECKEGKACGCSKGKKSTTKMAVQADMEGPGQVPGARTGQPPANNEDKQQPSDDIDPEKACQILRDGQANGQPLTEDQRRMFGAACAQSKAFGDFLKSQQPDQSATPQVATGKGVSGPDIRLWKKKVLCGNCDFEMVKSGDMWSCKTCGHKFDVGKNWFDEQRPVARKNSATGAGVPGTGLSESSGTAGGYTVGESKLDTPGHVLCPTCDGSGNCSDCGGVGAVQGVDCPYCEASGNCPKCGGVGATAKLSTETATKTSKAKTMKTTKADPTETDRTMDDVPEQGNEEEKDSVDEPFNPMPGAAMLAKLYKHYKAAQDFIDQRMPMTDHPGVREFMAAHKEAVDGIMGACKDAVDQHYGDQGGGYFDKCMKALESDGAGPTDPTGEAGLVDQGDVPPDAAKDSVEEPFNPEPGDAQDKSEDRDTVAEPPAPFNKQSDPSTEEINERYQDSKSGKWMTRKVGVLRRTEDGKAYLVKPKANGSTTKASQMTDAGRTQRTGGSGSPLTQTGHEQRTGGSGSQLTFSPGEQASQAANTKHGEYIVGSGQVDWGKKTKSYHSVVTKAISHLDSLSIAPDLPKHHASGLLYHASELAKVTGDMEASWKAAEDAAKAPQPAPKKEISQEVQQEFAAFKRQFRQITGLQLNGK